MYVHTFNDLQDAHRAFTEIDWRYTLLPSKAIEGMSVIPLVIIHLIAVLI